ncbi:hypothetical protein V6Z11_D02G137000 [Gossypium hirsutum]
MPTYEGVDENASSSDSKSEKAKAYVDTICTLIFCLDFFLG